MSGIFGFLNQDGAPANLDYLRTMAAMLARRGPDGAHVWNTGPLGLGHTLLATTPEALHERLPFVHMATGCVITADARLDNRDELLLALGLRERASTIGDGQLILSAYLAWDRACVERLLGDFAFAIWDPRRLRLFCARDQLGMRPFTYHYAPGKIFVFASEPRAILVQPRTSYRLNEGRIADFLVGELEGIDKTSTFFTDVYRLPPAHTLTVSPKELRIQRYWTLEAGSELRLSSDEDYADAFRHVFTQAVKCRLRSADRIGSMLSGGMDSGSVVAVARTLLAETGEPPLSTFSGIGPDPSACPETRSIHAALTMDGLNPHTINLHSLDALTPELDEVTWTLDEPFDAHMTLPRSVYLAAHRTGIKVLLDGVGGDSVFVTGGHLAQLMRSGLWLTAYREALAQQCFWGDGSSAWREFYQNARAVFVPDWMRRIRRNMTHRRALEREIKASIISRDFAHSISVASRLETLEGHSYSVGARGNVAERAKLIDHPFLTVGRERYDRVATSLSIEPRDPFLDRRVIAFCLSLPGDQLQTGGWPKIILRRAMAGRVPDAIRWRRGKEGLGWPFTAALIERTRQKIRDQLDCNTELLRPYVDLDALDRVRRAAANGGEDGERSMQSEHDAAHLAAWLNRHQSRPKVEGDVPSRTLQSHHPGRSNAGNDHRPPRRLTDANQLSHAPASIGRRAVCRAQ